MSATHPKYSHAHCLNCEIGLEPNAQYCPHCGQRVRDTPLPVRAFLGDFFQDYFTVDAKFFRSIAMLLGNPGTMTRIFNEGKRLSFIAPFRLYIFVSVAYFFLLAYTNRDSNFDFFNAPDPQYKAQLQAIDSLIADTALYPNQSELREAIYQLRQANQNALDSSDASNEDFIIDLDEGDIDGSSSLNQALTARWQRIKENPALYKQAFFKSASVGAFFLLPLFALLLMMSHYRRSSFYVNHLVFSVHFHTYVFFIFSLYLLLGLWSEVLRHWLITLSTLFYFVLTLRTIWSQWPKSHVKKLLIVIFLALFAFCIYLAFSVKPGENDVIALFVLGVSYLTLSLMNAYSQGFLRSVMKTVMIVPVYLFMLLFTLIGVAIVGIVLA